MQPDSRFTRRFKLRMGRQYLSVFVALLVGILLSLTTFHPQGRSTAHAKPAHAFKSLYSGSASIVSTTYDAGDLVVVDYNATSTPYFADASGNSDATAAIQNALNDCSNDGGGTVWLPAGKYRVTGSIVIPPHTTLRGDWRDPDTGSGSYGTVILADVAPGGENDPGLFRISGSAGVNGLTVYYPNQSIQSPIQYPYTFEILGRLLNEDGYMMATVKRVTLLNAYRGISAGAQATHELHTIYQVKGTALANGLYLQDSADVDKTENVTFNSSYWANLDGSVAESHPGQDEINNWTRNNGVGMKLAGLEWDHLANLSFSDYQIGIDTAQQRRAGLSANLFGVTVLNSNIALRINGDNVDPNLGLHIANSTLQANQGTNPVAVQVNNGSNSSIIFNKVTIGGGATTAVQLNSYNTLEFHNCTFDNWSGEYAIVINQGWLVVQGSTFSPTLSDTKKGILLQSDARSASILGNNYNGGPLLDNNTGGTVFSQVQGFGFPDTGIDAYTFASVPRPGNTNLYNVLSYNARADGTTDDTEAIQNALNDAGNAGGGTVYLPAGIYVIRGHLSVPAGVELRGADAVPHRTQLLNGGKATGTILYAYEGRGTGSPDSDAALITLNGNNSGTRGISIHYPEQANDNVANIVSYPWSIRGNGSGVYAYDISFSNTFRGIDFASNNTDGHYLSGINGFALDAGIKVGNSNEGWIENSLFNINAWARTGGLPNSVDEGTTMFSVGAAYARSHATSFQIDSGAANEHLMADFVYGTQTGFQFAGNATAINIGVDGSVNTVDISSGTATILNLNGCGCGLNGIGVHIRGGTGRVFNLSTLTTFNQAIQIDGGSYSIQGGMITSSFARITGGDGILAGVWFKDPGTQVTVSGSGTIANLWGNLGYLGFGYAFNDGAPLLIAGNIPT